MSTTGNGPRSGGEDAAFEAAWRDIVAHFDEPIGRDVDTEDVRPQADRAEKAVAEQDFSAPTKPVIEEQGFPALADSDAEAVDVEQEFEAQRAADLDDLAHPDRLQPDPLPWAPTEPDDSAITFKPPTPPLPRSTPERWLAWLTLLGVPVVVVLCTVFSYTPTEMLRWAMGLAWLGSFAYLIATMNDAPRDPWDDGSRV